jgi:sulfate adenylyltransferase
MMQKNSTNDLMPSNKEELKQKALEYNSWRLTERKICDVESLLNGAFTPLKGFFGKMDYQTILKNLRLSNGTLWPMPITFDVGEAFAGGIS